MEKKYYRYRIENLLVVQKIVTVHYFEFSKTYKNDGETHDFWELVYADKGQIFCTAGEERVLLKQGEAIFHRPDEFHALAADGRTAANVFIVSFECRSEAMRFFEGKRLRLSAEETRLVYAIAEEARRTFDIPFSDPNAKKMPLKETPALGGLQVIKNRLELLLISLMRAETEKKDADAVFLPEEEMAGHVAELAAAYLKERVYGRASAEEMCRALNYNRSYVFRQFRKATGETPMRYYQRLKIEEAKRLLREGMSAAQTAAALSFDTPDYFSKVFRKFAACTPSQYKKRGL